MEDYGLIFGTGIFMLFGFFFAFVLPKMMNKDEADTEDGRRLRSWLRWLGLTLVILSLAAAIAISLLPEELARQM